VLAWRLDRWGWSLIDLVGTLKDLTALGVAFVSLTEALDLTTPTSRAMGCSPCLRRHEILRERIREGIAEARLKGIRPASDCRQEDRPDPKAIRCRRQSG
jgi:DNA invertase Pin-like site-specific DNA recombinase